MPSDSQAFMYACSCLAHASRRASGMLGRPPKAFASIDAPSSVPSSDAEAAMRSRVPTGVNAPPARSPGANGAGLRLSPPSRLSRRMMLPVETGELRPSEGAGERRLSGGFSCKLSTKSSKTLVEAKGGRGTKGLVVGHPHGGSPASDSLHTLAEPVE